MLTYGESRVIGLTQTKDGPWVAILVTDHPYEFAVVNLETMDSWGPYGTVDVAFAKRWDVVDTLGGISDHEPIFRIDSVISSWY